MSSIPPSLPLTASHLHTRFHTPQAVWTLRCLLRPTPYAPSLSQPISCPRAAGDMFSTAYKYTADAVVSCKSTCHDKPAQEGFGVHCKRTRVKRCRSTPPFKVYAPRLPAPTHTGEIMAKASEHPGAVKPVERGRGRSPCLCLATKVVYP